MLSAVAAQVNALRSIASLDVFFPRLEWNSCSAWLSKGFCQTLYRAGLIPLVNIDSDISLSCIVLKVTTFVTFCYTGLLLC